MLQIYKSSYPPYCNFLKFKGLHRKALIRRPNGGALNNLRGNILSINPLSKLQKLFTVILILAGASSFNASAQNVGIKTNLVSDALLSPNLAIEVGVAPKWTLNVAGQANLWNVNGHKWRHWLVQPEARYWLCDKFAGHFFGVHAIGGQYNFGNIKNSLNFLGSKFSNLTDYRYQGWGAGAGIAYGYDWVLGKHWNLEAEIGIGWIYTRYDKFSCYDCGRKLESNRPHNYVGPTKIDINLEYIF